MPQIRPRRLGTSLGVSLTLGLVACGGYSKTVRVFDGREVEGRPVPSGAYAAYLTAASLEQQGKNSAALAAYRTALSYDDDSVEIRTRIANLVCQTNFEEADEAFTDAISRDAHYEPAWRAWARCALSRKRPSQALHLAWQALGAAPEEFAATDVLAQVLEARGEVGEAQHILVGYAATFEYDPRAWKRLAKFAQDHGLTAWAEEASLRYRSLRLAAGRPYIDLDSARLQLELTRELRAGDLGKARALAVEARINPTTVAVIAAELGLWATALSQAELVLAVDPADGDARLVLFVASYRLGESRETLLSLQPGASRWPSPRAGLLLGALLREQGGDEAARALASSLAREGSP